MSTQSNQKGLIALPIIIATIVISSAVLVAASSSNLTLNIASFISPTLLPTPSPTPIPTPTATPSPQPTLSSTPSPSVPASSQPTSKPSTQTTTTVVPDSGYARISVNTEKGTFTASVVTLGIGSKMVTDTTHPDNCEKDCPTNPLTDYINGNGAYAGINGTYFCPADYSECESKKNSFDFPVYNSRLNKWINGDKLFWNDRAIIYQDGTGMHFLRNASSFGGGLTGGIVNYPGLLDNGEVVAESYPLSDKLRAKGTKGGIGFNESKIYLVIAYGVDAVDFAHVFKSLGAKYALNLDGGGSSALYYGGYKVGPGRALPNAVVFR